MGDDGDDNYGGHMVIHSGICYELHKAKPLRYECFGNFVNIIKGLLCIAMFVYVLAKMSKNHRRALAGYTKNTGCWTICWGVLKVFDVTNTKRNGQENLESSDEKLFATAHCFCFAVSSFVEVIIILLLCSTSIGKNNFYRSWFVASFWAFVTFMVMILVIVLKPGPGSQYWISRNMEWVLLARAITTVAMNVLAVAFYHRTGSDRAAVLRYSKYMIAIYSALAISRGCQLSTDFITANFGICALDLSEIVHFFSFAPVVYLTLKRDCQYWSTDVDDDEEDALVKHTNEMTWSELPNYKGVVIPKTELFYRSKIMDQVDVTVEIHLWRRKLAVVKRFKFDLLTRDNIKFFKVEANIFKTLAHENIVDFYGVLVDPPSLGIVMKYCINGDVFKRIEKEREALESRVSKASPPSKDRYNSMSNIAPSESNTTNRSSLMVTDMHMIHSFKNATIAASPLSEESIEIASVASSTNPMRRGSTDENSIRESQRTTSVWRQPSKLGGFRASIMGLKSSVDASVNQFEPLLCAIQVANGMNYLHSQNITHRDLKSMNVLLDESFNAQIADFGESIIDRSGQNTHMTGQKQIYVGEMGTAGWAAPEMILGRGASKASDVFSYGIVLWELLTWRVPSVMISVGMLQEDSVRCHASTFEHPLLEIIRQQRALPKEHMPPSSFLGVFGHGSGSLGHLSGGKSSSGPQSAGRFARSALDKRSASTLESKSEEHKVRSNSFSGDLITPTTFSLQSPSLTETSSTSKRKSSSRKSLAAFDSGTMTAERNSLSELEAPLDTDLHSDSTGQSAGKFSQREPVFRTSGTSAVYDRKTMSPSALSGSGKQFPPISDDDFTMIEVGDMRIAEELFCKRNLRPPLPVGIPASLVALIQRCWCVDPKLRPTFPEIIAELDKVIIQQRVNFDLPCEVEARINYALDADLGTPGTDSSEV